MSYFVVSEAGISWDLSSHVYNDVKEILGATCLSGLVEHSTSCSLWMEETTGWVTTLCPGNASNFAWGSSGRRKGLQNATRNISNEARGPSHDMEENIGGSVVERLQF